MLEIVCGVLLEKKKNEQESSNWADTMHWDRRTADLEMVQWYYVDDWYTRSVAC